jgi:hypothetical protein
MRRTISVRAAARGRPSVPPRLRIFLGCEGESERGYGAFLGQLLQINGCHVHLDTVLLRPNGGDPLALVELACRRVVENERKRGRYAFRAVLLDADRMGQMRVRDVRILPVAAAARLRLIWQRPCHEALLLRHLDGCRDRQPATTALAEQELKRHWPEYEKGMSAVRLAARLGARELRQALEVEHDLAALVSDLGFR